MFGLGAIRDMVVSIQLVDNITRPLSNINKTLDATKSKMGGLLSTIQRNTRAVTIIGAALAAASAPALLFARSSVSAMAEFEAAMANVSTMVDTTTENMELMSEQVLGISKRVPIAAVDLANALYQVRSAGVDAANAMTYLEVAAKAAVAGVTDTTTAVNAITAVIKGYGLQFSEAQNVSDKLFKTVQLGQTTFEELATSIGGVVPLAKALGVSLDELLASYATLTGVTGNTAEVTTQLESIMSGFIKPTTELERTIKQLGYSTSKEMIAELGLVGALKKVIATTDGSAEALGDLFARKEAITAILALLGPQLDNYNKKLLEMKNSAGAMNEAYLKNSETFMAATQKMSNAIFALKVSFGTALAPAIKVAAEGITKLVNVFNSLPKPVKNIIAVTTTLTAVTAGLAGTALLTAAAFTSAIAYLGGTSAIIGTVTGAFTGLASAISAVSMALLTNPITWAILAIVGAVLLLQHAWVKNWGGIQEKTERVIRAIRTGIDWLVSGIKWLISQIINAYNKIKPVFDILSFALPGVGQLKLAGELAAKVGLPTPGELAATTIAPGREHVTNINKTVGRIEIKVEGAGDPDKVAEKVVKKIERQFMGM